jgi:hypothetical protein
MNMFILDNELYVRFGFFFGIFAVMAPLYLTLFFPMDIL